MGPLNEEIRRMGRKAMEKSLTEAAKVRRQLKAGRPRKIRNQVIPTFEAIRRIADEADRARGLMREYGVEPDDIKLALIYATPDRPGFEQFVGYKWLPSPEDIGRLYAAFEDEAHTAALLYLGILWFQVDRVAKAKGEDWQFAWVTQFLAGREAEKRQFAARDAFVRGGNVTQDN